MVPYCYLFLLSVFILLYFGSAIILVTYFGKNYLGKSCSFGFLRVPFVNCRQFMYLVISILVLRTGSGI